jgi:hypothetical protein
MSDFKRLATGAVAAALMGMTAAPLYAQLPAHLRDYQLAAPKASGDVVGPMFNGWYKNDDGSYTFNFGFVIRPNPQEETITINVPFCTVIDQIVVDTICTGTVANEGSTLDQVKALFR